MEEDYNGLSHAKTPFWRGLAERHFLTNPPTMHVHFGYHISMAHIARIAPRYSSVAPSCSYSLLRLSTLPVALLTRRGFHSTLSRHTDGVFRELTSMRVRTPWIEALRRQQTEEKSIDEPSSRSDVPKHRDLSPKHMDDSYHSVILPLAQDPWLLDTYLNSSGHIRLGTIFMDLDALSGVIA